MSLGDVIAIKTRTHNSKQPQTRPNDVFLAPTRKAGETDKCTVMQTAAEFPVSVALGGGRRQEVRVRRSTTLDQFRQQVSLFLH